MKNIGPAMESWLKAAGIKTPKEVETLGAVECYRRIRVIERAANNLMALYALYGAIHNVNCLHLAPEVKEILQEMLAEADK